MQVYFNFTFFMLLNDLLPPNPLVQYTCIKVGQVSTGLEGNSAVILLQIVIVSPGTHLVKNHECSQPRTNESQ